MSPIPIPFTVFTDKYINGGKLCQQLSSPFSVNTDTFGFVEDFVLKPKFLNLMQKCENCPILFS